MNWNRNNSRNKFNDLIELNRGIKFQTKNEILLQNPMKISVYYIGKNETSNLQEVISLFEKRIKHYIPFQMISLGKPRITSSQPPIRHKERESELIIKVLSDADVCFLLDPKGKEMTSEAFSKFIQRFMNKGIRHLVFIIGGAYGFSAAVYHAVPGMISLSQLTFPHQLTRLVLVEQIYRALTIINGEPYHHS